MAAKLPTPKDPADQGFIALLVPYGATRSRRLVVPHDVAEWLFNELGTALAELKAEAKARRRSSKEGGRRG